MWNKLRARHYSILVLLSIVTLETSAIAIDRYLSKGDDVAFEVEGRFRNNAFVSRFQQAEARHGAVPATLSQVAQIAQTAELRAAAARGVKPVAGVPAPASKAVPAFDTWIEYTVKKGDSLKAIAEMFDTKSAVLAQGNGLTTGNIKVGQKLRVPMMDNRLAYKVRAGDSLNKIASRFNSSIPEIIRENNLKNHVLIEDQKIYIPMKPKQELTIARSTVEPVIAPPLIKIDKPTANLALVKGPTLQIAAATPDKPNLTIVQSDAAAKPAPAAAIQAAPTAPRAAAPKAAPQAPAIELLPSIAKAIEAKAAAQQNSMIRPVVAMAPAAKPIAPALTPKTAAVPETPTIQVAQAAKPVVQEAPKPQKPALDADTRLVAHTVKNGENLSTIARQYKTSISDILQQNPQSSSNLKVGQQVNVPVNKKYYRVMQVTSRKADVSTRMVLPVRGRLSDSYGWRKHPVYRKRLFHAGVDISAPRGTAISAAMGGTVVYAGWLSGYGKLVVIRHPNGLSTRYGHCSSIRVKRGQTVRTGQTIAGVGATGVATGNHLHFEVRRNGRTINPSPMIFGR
ncbi:MAG TPA: LysM peptidoglycan-binding domain-containing protein [Candidatus Ozemobacteraceae bacterium]|nr:LysM peptidoglycan-binding domain-containing protein [Candidatus Ozemobacteraceae bacterium]